MNEVYPENPSYSKDLQFKCEVCGKGFKNKDNFLNHLEKNMHRVCYKCGYKVGRTIDWMRGKFVAERIVLNKIVTWKYKHRECPMCEPSKRGKYYQGRTRVTTFFQKMVNHDEGVA